MCVDHMAIASLSKAVPLLFPRLASCPSIAHSEIHNHQHLRGGLSLVGREITRCWGTAAHFGHPRESKSMLLIVAPVYSHSNFFFSSFLRIADSSHFETQKKL